MQALAAVGRHFADMWLDFGMWHTRPVAGGGGKDAALAVLDRASKVPASFRDRSGAETRKACIRWSTDEDCSPCSTAPAR